MMQRILSGLVGRKRAARLALAGIELGNFVAEAVDDPAAAVLHLARASLHLSLVVPFGFRRLEEFAAGCWWVHLDLLGYTPWACTRCGWVHAREVDPVCPEGADGCG